MAMDFLTWRLAACLLILSGLGFVFASPLTAQTLSTSSMAGVIFPLPSRNWNADTDGLKAFEIERAATLASRKCGAREFHTWPAKDLAAANSLRERTDTAFGAAGWSLTLISRTDDGKRTYLSGKTGRELVMVWLPTNAAIGLLLCAAERLDNRDQAPARLADQAPAPPSAPKEAQSGPAEANAVPSPADPAPAVALQAAPSLPIAAPATPSEVAAQRESLGEAAEPPLLPAKAQPVDRSFWSRLLAWVVTDLLAIGGGLLIVRALRAMREEGREDWLTASGKVLRSLVEVRQAQAADGSLKSMFKPVVVYQYDVAGVSLEGRRIRPGETVEASREAAEAIIARFPVDAVIGVRYHRFEPENPTIEMEGRGLDLRLAIGFIGLVAAAMVLFFFG